MIDADSGQAALSVRRRRASQRNVADSSGAALALIDLAQLRSRHMADTRLRGARRLKTDRRDAQALSEVSCRLDLPSVHVPSRQGAGA